MQVSQLLNGHPNRTLAAARPERFESTDDLDRWLGQLRPRISALLTGFVQDRCAEYVRDVPGAEFVTSLLTEFVPGGKYVRSTFTYLGWLSGSRGPTELSEELDAPLRAAASTELMHAFALFHEDGRVAGGHDDAPWPERRRMASMTTEKSRSGTRSTRSS